jgi:hypothetical protein
LSNLILHELKLFIGKISYRITQFMKALVTLSRTLDAGRCGPLIERSSGEDRNYHLLFTLLTLNTNGVILFIVK